MRRWSICKRAGWSGARCSRRKILFLPSLRGAKRRSNPFCGKMDCFASLAMTTIISLGSHKENSMSANNALHIAVLAGDGIGPEVMAPALEGLRKIESASDLKVRVTEAHAGGHNYLY